MRTAMAPAFSALAAATLVLGACRCTEPPPAPRLYHSPDFGFSLEYPAGWVWRHARNSVLFVPSAEAATDSAAGGQPLYIALEVLTSLDARGQPRELQAVSEAGLASLRAEADFAVTLDEQATIGDSPARHVLCSFERSGQRYRAELLYIRRPQQFVALYLLAPATRFEAQRAHFQAMLLTLRFADPA